MIPMPEQQYGRLRINRVDEGGAGLPMSMALPGIGDADLARLARWFQHDSLTAEVETSLFYLNVHSYVLHCDGKVIVIDSCNGNHKQRSVPFAHMLDTPYLANLAAQGVRPEDVDMVMCTHLHADHVGWNTRLDNGQWVPTFPNARYIFGRTDYEFFSTQEHEVFHREAYLDSVLPVVAAGLADIVEESTVVHHELGDGIWLEPAFGHSPGSCIVNAKCGGQHAVFSGDIIHHPVQMVRPDLHFFADEDPARASVVRKSLLERAAEQEIALFPAHFCGTSGGFVKRDEASFKFEFLV